MRTSSRCSAHRYSPKEREREEKKQEQEEDGGDEVIIEQKEQIAKPDTTACTL